MNQELNTPYEGIGIANSKRILRIFTKYAFEAGMRGHYFFYFMLTNLSAPFIFTLLLGVLADILEYRHRREGGKASPLLKFVVRLFMALYVLSFVNLTVQNLILQEYPLYNPLYLAASAAVCIGLWVAASRLWNSTTLITSALAVVCASLLIFGRVIGLFIVIYIIFIAALLGWGFLGGKCRELAPSLHLGLTALCIMLAAVFVKFYFTFDPGAAHRVIAQPGVESIFTRRSEDPAGDVLGHSQVYSITPGCRKHVLYISTRRGDAGLLEFPLGGKPMIRYKEPVSDNIAKDCANKHVYAGGFDKNLILEFNITPFGVRHGKDISISERSPILLAMAPGLNRLFAATDNNSFHIIDTKTGREIYHRAKTGRSIALFGRDIIVSDFHDIRKFRLNTRADGMKLIKSVRNPDISGQGATLADPPRKRAYLNNYLNGWLYTIDARTLSAKKRVKLEPGIRFIDMPPDRSRIVSVGHIHGNVYIIDPVTLKVIRKVYVGRRARRVTFSDDSRFAYVASAAGGFRISLR